KRLADAIGDAPADPDSSDFVNPDLLDDYDRALVGMIEVAESCRPDRPPPPFDADTRSRMRLLLSGNRRNRTMVHAFKRTCHLLSRRRKSIAPRLWGTVQQGIRRKLWFGAIAILVFFLVFVTARRLYG